MSVLLAAVLAANAGEERLVTAAGMKLRGSVVDGVLHAEVTAPTHGWVAVGVNTRPTLDGSVLVMAAVRQGVLVVEEHVAQPPNHPSRRSRGGVDGLLPGSVGAETTAPTTTVRFALRLDTGDSFSLRPAPDAPLHITLAWSRDDDFGHHSAMRELVAVVFP
jgi:hypothetical protein